MSEQISSPVNPPIPQNDPERWKNLVVVLILVTTVFAALLAGLQADASIRSDIANRDSQYYAVLASAELFRAGLQGNYDLQTMANFTAASQEALVMQFSALQMEQDGDKRGAESSALQGSVTQARADRIKTFSIFFTDPRYAPASEGEMPNVEAYLTDAYVAANALVKKQNDASDAYHVWSAKSDSYVAVLTILAVAFFLFGLAQALSPRMRLIFAGIGMLVELITIAWTVMIFIG